LAPSNLAGLDARTLLDQCRALAREAGGRILAVAAEGRTEVEAKTDGSPLTRADRASHEVIVAGLAELLPETPILSEEGQVESFRPGPGGRFWCVDPLDGTKEFVKGLGEYTVNIALVESARPVLGVVYVPVQGVFFLAAEGEGAFRAKADGPTEPITARRVERPEVAVVSRSHLSDQTRQFLEALGVGEAIEAGSSLKICAVAEGRADVYPRHGPTCLWDTAAGAIVAREAGCLVLDLQGRPLAYDPADGIRREGFLVFPEGLEATVRAAISAVPPS
jgi:3'(2'), 5'-bisphosphate nucleotidase